MAVIFYLSTPPSFPPLSLHYILSTSRRASAAMPNKIQCVVSRMSWINRLCVSYNEFGKYKISKWTSITHVGLSVVNNEHQVAQATADHPIWYSLGAWCLAASNVLSIGTHHRCTLVSACYCTLMSHTILVIGHFTRLLCNIWTALRSIWWG